MFAPSFEIIGFLFANWTNWHANARLDTSRDLHDVFHTKCNKQKVATLWSVWCACSLIRERARYALVCVHFSIIDRSNDHCQRLLYIGVLLINSLFVCFAGELLSHKSLLLILEDLQYKSRQLLRKLLVLTLWPKMMCGVLLFWVDAFTRYTGINVVFEVMQSKLMYSMLGHLISGQFAKLMK